MKQNNVRASKDAPASLKAMATAQLLSEVAAKPRKEKTPDALSAEWQKDIADIPGFAITAGNAIDDHKVAIIGSLLAFQKQKQPQLWLRRRRMKLKLKAQCEVERRT